MQYYCVTIPPAVRPNLVRQMDMGSLTCAQIWVRAVCTHEWGSGTKKSAQNLTQRDRKTASYPAPPEDRTQGLGIWIPTHLPLSYVPRLNKISCVFLSTAPNSDMDFWMFNLRLGSFVCVRIHTGDRHTHSESAQHFFYSEKTLWELFLVLLTGFEPRVFGSRVRCSTHWATPSPLDCLISTARNGDVWSGRPIICHGLYELIKTYRKMHAF